MGRSDRYISQRQAGAENRPTCCPLLGAPSRLLLRLVGFGVRERENQRQETGRLGAIVGYQNKILSTFFYPLGLDCASCYYPGITGPRPSSGDMPADQAAPRAGLRILKLHMFLTVPAGICLDQKITIAVADLGSV